MTKILLPYCENARIYRYNSFQDGIRYFDVKDVKYKLRKHAGLREYYEAIPDHIIKKLFKFVVIRNPYERLISAYFSPNTVFEKGSAEFRNDEFINLINNQRTLRDFVCVDETDTYATHIDKYLRFENLTSDFQQLVTDLNLGRISLPHYNKSKKSKPWQAYYNRELVDLVYVRFHEEIDHFGYSIDL